MTIRPATQADAEAIAAIYAPFVRETAITFELEPPDGTEIARRIAAAGDLYPWLVVEGEDGGIAAYTYASPFRTRRAYRFCVETTVYVAPGRHRMGHGRRVYEALLDVLAKQRFTQAIAAIALPNEPSIALHEALGFRHGGTYLQAGWKLGRWHDVGLWQRPLTPTETPPQEPVPWSGLMQL